MFRWFIWSKARGAGLGCSGKVGRSPLYTTVDTVSSSSSAVRCAEECWLLVECGEQSDMVDESGSSQVVNTGKCWKGRSVNVGCSGARGWSLFLSYSTTGTAPGTLERGARNNNQGPVGSAFAKVRRDSRRRAADDECA